MAILLVGILIFAGVTLGVLATFLIASETELTAELDESSDSGAKK